MNVSGKLWRECKSDCDCNTSSRWIHIAELIRFSENPILISWMSVRIWLDPLFISLIYAWCASATGDVDRPGEERISPSSNAFSRMTLSLSHKTKNGMPRRRKKNGKHVVILLHHGKWVERKIHGTVWSGAWKRRWCQEKNGISERTNEKKSTEQEMMCDYITNWRDWCALIM